MTLGILIEKQNRKRGDMVLLAEDNTPALQWSLGIVLEAHSGNYDLVRVAKIETNADKITVRSVAKLRKWPLN